MKKSLSIILFVLFSIVGYSQTDGINHDVIIGHSITYDAVTPITDDLDVVPLWMMNQTVAGALVHAQCEAATTVNITLSGEQTIDNYSAVTGNRILVKDQTLPENNGVYIVGVPWTRATDLDSWTELYRSAVFIVRGAINSGSSFTSYMDETGTLGVDTIIYNKTSEIITPDMSQYKIDSIKTARNKVILYTPISTDSTTAIFNEYTPTESVTGLTLTGTGKVINGNLALSTTSGYRIPRITELDSAKTAYEDKVNSLAVTGTTTKTITLTRQDGGTVTGTFIDADTAQNLSYDQTTRNLLISRGGEVNLPLATLNYDGLLSSNGYWLLREFNSQYNYVFNSWNGTFDGKEGSYYLDYTNLTHKPTIPVISNVAYGPSWSTATTEGASKAALYAKIETLGSGTSNFNPTITSVSNNNLLQYNGSAWVNRTLAQCGIQPAGTYLTTEVDGSVSNEGLLTVGGITGDVTLTSNTSTSPTVTLHAGRNQSISKSSNTITFAVSASDSAYDATLWNGNNSVFTKNAFRDLWEAPIVATKIGGGLISNTEFSYLNNVTSNIQTQLNAKLATSKISNSVYNSVKWDGSDSVTTQDKIRDKLVSDSLAIANKHFLTNAYFSIIPFDKSLRFLTFGDGGETEVYTMPKASVNNDGLLSPDNLALFTGKLDSTRVSTDLYYNRATWINSNKVPTQKTLTNKLYLDSLVWGYAANKVLGIEIGAEKNVQPDYTQEDTLADSYIKHKPEFLPGNALVKDSSKFDITESGINKIITAKAGINNLTLNAANNSNQVVIGGSSGASTIIRNISGTTEILNSNNHGFSIQSFGNIGIKKNNSILYQFPTDAGTAGQVIHSNGPGGICYWGDVEGGTGGSGTVVSVGLSLPDDFNVSGSPVTNSGTLAATWAVKPANTFLGATNGISGVPTFRTLVDDDIPNTITASNYLPLIGGTLAGKLTIPANTPTSAMLRITPFTSNPTSLSDGDIWATASGVYARINGGTISLGNSGNNGLTTFTSSETWGLYNGDITGKNPYPMVTINGLYADTPELSDEIMFSDISSLTTPKKLYKTTLSTLKSLINTSVLTVRDIDRYTTIPTCTEIVFENAVVSQNGTVATITIPESGGGGGGTEAFQTLSSSGNLTWSWLTSKNANILDVDGNIYLTITEQSNGQEAELWVYPDLSTDYTLTFNNSSTYYANDHSNVFNIEHGTHMYVFTMKANANRIRIDYATYKN